jgi:hypothetical protein
LADIHKELAARDNAPNYVKLVNFRLKALLTDCGFHTLAERSNRTRRVAYLLPICCSRK